ncbi:hypothetical protein A2X44_01905 [candidate division CPR3 bacterium GWF2_35_18]|uniref:Uncharacterized protein n=1 Tax=candidate division CPR3 bacterium GW2011_GWF2_35_18 TaxID=1618350 RepID=A0A0G0BKC1_UNCC3|nr:MAG: hypothetical protein UR67_C0002G0064 [candidate division CPR3 bacterium GW2011_GWF2_35_18]OGB62754.1 MAG: hypothetical protein A2X44_01905 [candidate division CPR3 bacterium GWF2_35_18]OGB65335.1 MAG: hypothetical protein A2250_00120 [candidate division CPR3 bacterium RIFOXYA2_FULL_35_13]OGB76001.1 MAG: hypothetical protein A2476_05535 [candidate division CPR3 bacterium RIFOXYC2_FULL_35_7]OGB78297.1 MAG: hypothetical protein A2296_02895 [candidate division CPR3 bacterium RIFOXYB2_FULL_3
MDNQVFDRKKLTEDIFVLLAGSLLFTISQKEKIEKTIDNFTDDELISFAKLLVTEEQNKISLDKKMINAVENSLNKVQE